jgi:hypothetical protein
MMNPLTLTILSYYPRCTELCRECQTYADPIREPYRTRYLDQQRVLESYSTTLRSTQTQFDMAKMMWVWVLESLMNDGFLRLFNEHSFDDYIELIEDTEDFFYRCQNPPCVYSTVDQYYNIVKSCQSMIIVALHSLSSIIDRLISVKIRRTRGMYVHVRMEDLSLFHEQTLDLYTRVISLRHDMDDYLAFIVSIQEDLNNDYHESMFTTLSHQQTLKVPVSFF